VDDGIEVDPSFTVLIVIVFCAVDVVMNGRIGSLINLEKTKKSNEKTDQDWIKIY